MAANGDFEHLFFSSPLIHYMRPLVRCFSNHRIVIRPKRQNWVDAHSFIGAPSEFRREELLTAARQSQLIPKNGTSCFQAIGILPFDTSVISNRPFIAPDNYSSSPPRLQQPSILLQNLESSVGSGPISFRFQGDTATKVLQKMSPIPKRG